MYGVYNREQNTSERDCGEAMADLSRDSLLLPPTRKPKRRPNPSLFIDSSEDSDSSLDEENKQQCDSPAWDYDEMEPSTSKYSKSLGANQRTT